MSDDRCVNSPALHTNTARNALENEFLRFTYQPDKNDTNDQIKFFFFLN